MTNLSNGAKLAFPSVVSKYTANAAIAQTIEPRILTFIPRCDTCHLAEKACNCDTYLGSCDGCGTHVYGGDMPRVADGVITCPTCLAEEKSWKKVVQPEVFAVAA